MCSFIIHSKSSGILKNKYYQEAVFFLKRLIFSDIDSTNGIKVTVDAPTGNDAMLNIERPAVIRQEYGLNTGNETLPSTKIDNNDIVDRYFYGQTSSRKGYNQVGTYPQDQYTRLMPESIRSLGEYLLNLVKNSPQLVQNSRKNSRIEFKELNHLSVLIYFGLEGFKKCSTLNYHCDNTYTPGGKFCSSLNTQAENTPTITLTLGDSRVLRYQRRIVNSSGNWEVDNSFFHSELMDHGSIGVVHPDDERPFKMKIKNRYRTVQYQHGKCNVPLDRLSVVFVFRSVTTHTNFVGKTGLRIFEREPSVLEEIKHAHLHRGIDKAKFHCRLKKLYKKVFD